MHTSSFDFPRPNFLSFFDNPLCSQGSSSSLQGFQQCSGSTGHCVDESLDVPFLNYTMSDYRVGRTDTLHATMVYEFLRVFCQEEPSRQAADAVVIVDIQGGIRGYGRRHDSTFAEALERRYGCLITDMLAESVKRQWLNQNIECLALQRQHWRLFRLYDAETTFMVLMEFHPVEIQRTALVLWVLGG